MKFTLLSITEKEMKNNNLHLDESVEVDKSLIKGATKVVYVLGTENGAKILLSKDVLKLENGELEVNKNIVGAVSKVMPKISYKDFDIIEKVRSGVESISKLFSNITNYERAFNYLDYVENKRSNTKIEYLDISPNDVEIFFTVLSGVDANYLEKDIHLEINEEETKSIINTLDNEQRVVNAANSKNRIFNSIERSKFNILGIVAEISSEYKKDLTTANELASDDAAKRIRDLRPNNPKVSNDVLKKLG